MWHLFEGVAYLRAACTERLDATQNCFNYGIIIFRIKITELTSFDFDYIRAAALIRVNRIYLYKQGLHYSRQERSKPESDGYACLTQ